MRGKFIVLDASSDYANMEDLGPFDTVEEAVEAIQEDTAACWAHGDDNRFNEPEVYTRTYMICQVMEILAVEPKPKVTVNTAVRRANVELKPDKKWPNVKVYDEA